MNARRQPSPPATSFTKGEVNRAGVLLLGLRDERKLGEAWEALTWWRRLHARPLSAVAANLRYHVDGGDASVHGRIEVTQRLKRLDTLIGKLAREQGSVTQMHDIGGVRAVLPSLRHVFVIRRRLLRSWVIIKERDYVTTPKDSGYRALHLIVRRNGYPVEVQLRTVLQDAWANQVEEDGRQIGVGLKFGAGAAEVHAYYAAVSDAFAFLDGGEAIPDGLTVTLSDLHAKIGESAPRGEDHAMSPDDDIKHFLVTRDVERRKTTIVEFGTDYEVAQHAYQEAEQKAWRRQDLDIVLLSSDSLETIKRTHSSYFNTHESFEALLPAEVLHG